MITLLRRLRAFLSKSVPVTEPDAPIRTTCLPAYPTGPELVQSAHTKPLYCVDLEGGGNGFAPFLQTWSIDAHPQGVMLRAHIYGIPGGFVSIGPVLYTETTTETLIPFDQIDAIATSMVDWYDSAAAMGVDAAVLAKARAEGVLST